MRFYYLRAEDIRTINYAFCGPGAGVRDEVGFMSIVDKPAMTYLGQDLYPGVFEKACAYLHGFATTQFFRDGNKRTSFLSATVFLDIHGYEWQGPDVDAAEEFLLSVAAKQVDEPGVIAWLKERCVPKQ
ncbi:type II toxin-antitoxin system death-on-curing family toxin [Microbacterium sp. JZ101]